MSNLTVDSNTIEVVTIKKELDLSSQKERIEVLYNEFIEIQKEYPKNEIYNIVTYLYDLKKELKKIS